MKIQVTPNLICRLMEPRPSEASVYYNVPRPQATPGKPWWKILPIILAVIGFLAGLAMLIYIVIRIEKLDNVSQIRERLL